MTSKDFITLTLNDLKMFYSRSISVELKHYLLLMLVLSNVEVESKRSYSSKYTITWRHSIFEQPETKCLQTPQSYVEYFLCDGKMAVQCVLIVMLRADRPPLNRVDGQSLTVYKKVYWATDADRIGSLAPLD